MGNNEDRPIEDVIGRVNLRKIVKEDRERIRNILLNVEIFTEDEVRVALSLIDVYFTGDEDYKFVVVAYESQVIGYACYGSTPMTSGTWDIYWMAILKEFQGNKIGTLLIREVEKEIQKRGARLILIETSSKESYNATREFYQWMGYKPVGKIERFYSEQDDKLIYGKYFERNIPNV